MILLINSLLTQEADPQNVVTEIGQTFSGIVHACQETSSQSDGIACHYCNGCFIFYNRLLTFLFTHKLCFRGQFKACNVPINLKH